MLRLRRLARAPSTRRRWSGHRLAASAFGTIVIVGVFAYLLPRIADYGEVWAVTRTMSRNWILVLGGVTVLNVLSNAPPWMAALPGLGFLHALRVALSASALTLVAPGGAALGVATQFGMLRGWGLGGRPAGVAAALTNIWGQLVSFSFPVVAAAALAAEGGHDRTLELVSLIGLVVFAPIGAVLVVALWSSALAQSIGDLSARVATRFKRLARRRPVRFTGHDLVGFRAETLELLRLRWHVLTLATLSAQLAVFAVLVVTLRAVGVTEAQVNLVEAFAAWSLIRALGKIPITPGGFGIEEVALAGALIGFGASNSQAVSVTLIYRFLTVVPIFVLGLAAAATYRLSKPRTAAGLDRRQRPDG